VIDPRFSLAGLVVGILVGPGVFIGARFCGTLAFAGSRLV
jgi:hypothetical protein